MSVGPFSRIGIPGSVRWASHSDRFVKIPSRGCTSVCTHLASMLWWPRIICQCTVCFAISLQCVYWNFLLSWVSLWKSFVWTTTTWMQSHLQFAYWRAYQNSTWESKYTASAAAQALQPRKQNVLVWNIQGHGSQGDIICIPRSSSWIFRARLSQRGRGGGGRGSYTRMSSLPFHSFIIGRAAIIHPFIHWVPTAK